MVASPKSTCSPFTRSSARRCARPRSRRHAGDVGDGEQLGGCAVQAGAGRADPDGDRQRGGVDAFHQRLDLVPIDHRPLRVDLQDECLGAVLGGTLDGVVDRGDDDRIEQSADLEHVDRPRCRWLLGARRVPATAQHSDAGRGAEQGDR